MYAEDNGQCLRKDMISITSAQTAEWRSRRSKLHLVGVALGGHKGADPVRDKRAIIDGYVSKQFSDVVARDRTLVHEVYPPYHAGSRSSVSTGYTGVTKLQDI